MGIPRGWVVVRAGHFCHVCWYGKAYSGSPEVEQNAQRSLAAGSMQSTELCAENFKIKITL